MIWVDRARPCRRGVQARSRRPGARWNASSGCLLLQHDPALYSWPPTIRREGALRVRCGRALSRRGRTSSRQLNYLLWRSRFARSCPPAAPSAPSGSAEDGRLAASRRSPPRKAPRFVPGMIPASRSCSRWCSPACTCVASASRGCRSTYAGDTRLCAPSRHTADYALRRLHCSRHSLFMLMGVSPSALLPGPFRPLNTSRAGCRALGCTVLPKRGIRVRTASLIAAAAAFSACAPSELYGYGNRPRLNRRMPASYADTALVLMIGWRADRQAICNSSSRNFPD